MTSYKAKMIQQPSVKGNEKRAPFIQGSLVHKKSLNANVNDHYYIIPDHFMILDGHINEFFPVKPETICQHVKYDIRLGDIWEEDVLVQPDYNVYFRVEYSFDYYQWRLKTNNHINDELKEIINSYIDNNTVIKDYSKLPFWLIDCLVLEKFGNLCDSE